MINQFTNKQCLHCTYRSIVSDVLRTWTYCVFSYLTTFRSMRHFTMHFKGIFSGVTVFFPRKRNTRNYPITHRTRNDLSFENTAFTASFARRVSELFPWSSPRLCTVFVYVGLDITPRYARGVKSGRDMTYLTYERSNRAQIFSLFTNFGLHGSVIFSDFV